MEKKNAKKESAFEAAKKYVDAQLTTMKEFGAAPRLSQRQYDALVRKVVAAAK